MSSGQAHPFASRRERDSSGNPLVDELHQGPAPGVLLLLAQEPSSNRVALERIAVHVLGQLFQPARLVGDEPRADLCRWAARERHLEVRKTQPLHLVRFVRGVTRIEVSKRLAGRAVMGRR